jgi:hypothetical protein
MGGAGGSLVSQAVSGEKSPMPALTNPRRVDLNVSIVSRSEALVSIRDHRDKYGDKYGDAVLELGWPVY